MDELQGVMLDSSSAIKKEFTPDESALFDEWIIPEKIIPVELHTNKVFYTTLFALEFTAFRIVVTVRLISLMSLKSVRLQTLNT